MGKARILLVEDEPIIARDLLSKLRSLGFDAPAAASSGEEAIRLAEELKPELILMDIILQGEMDGVEAAEKIRTLQDVPIVFVTSYVDDATLERAKITDPSGYILKPLRARELQAAIEIALHKHALGKKLRKSEVRFRTLADISPVGIFETDAGGQLIYLNGRGCEILGLSAEAAMGEGWLRRVHRDDSERAAAEWRKAVRNGVSFGADLRFVHPDGAQTWVIANAAPDVDEVGNVTGYVGTLTDITVRKRAEDTVREARDELVKEVHARTSELMQSNLALHMEVSERKQAQDELQKSENYFRSILFHMHEDILVIDRDYNVCDVNKDFLATVGKTRGAVIGRKCYEVTHGNAHPCSKSGYECLLPEVLRTSSSHTTVHETASPGGAKGWLKVQCSPFKDKAGEITHIIHAVTDVTQEVEMEARLRSAQKMESIGTLAGGIAHDFNNILTAIAGFTELVMQRLPKDQVEYEFLTEVLQSSQRARDLVKQILTFSRRNEQKSRPVHVGPVIKEALSLIRASLPSTIEIRQHISTKPDRDWILADSTQIHQILMNFCANAAHAMADKGGALEVGLTEEDFASAAQLPGPAMIPGSYLKLTVKDTGRGMSQEILERIFEPYFTTKKPSEGTGLGLAVVHGIVRGHGGEIVVQSVEGKGSTFSVFFPRVEHQTSQTGDKSDVAPPTGNARILIVDDEPSLVKVLRQMLLDLGYQVDPRNSSSGALDAFRDNPGAYDLVITDHTMPGLTGMDLASEMHRLRSDLPIILISGNLDTMSDEDAGAAGIRKYLRKPFNSRDIAEVVQKVLEG